MYLTSVCKALVALVLVVTLAACEDSEERAERYFQSGVTLLEQGEVEKALVEFRNVFNLDGAHQEARQTYARVVRDQGKLREAYGQYLRLVEQYPDNLEGRIALAEMAFATQTWDEFERHSAVAIKAAPEDPAVKTLAAAADYKTAAEDKDSAALNAALARATALAENRPDDPILRQLIISGNIENMTYSTALEATERGLKAEPDNRNLYNIRLSILARLEANDEIEAQLRDMVTRFPEDETIKQTLIRFYMSRQEPEKAEVFLREIADPNAEDPALYMALLQFIGELRGPDVLLAELDKVIPQVEDPIVYEALRAGLVFQQGDRTGAIARMEEIIAQAEPSAQTRRLQVSLAQMLLQSGNEVGARRLIEQVLSEDPTQVAALRMNAAWQIQSDDTDAAIAALRTALDQAPQDVAAMTLMSEAYQRAGNRDLARDFLSLAADTSSNAPAESIRYARFLSGEDRLAPAEQVLVAALRQNRNNPALLTELGQIYLKMEDNGRLRQVIANLKTIDTDAAKQAAASLEVTLVEREQGTDVAIEMLDGLTEDWGNTLTAKAAVIRVRLLRGEAEEALKTAEEMLAEDPKDPPRRYLMAATLAAAGKLAEAEEAYRALLEEGDKAVPRVWIGLMRTVSAQGRAEETEALLEDAIAANPAAPDLLWIRASNLERSGDIDGAIGIYEQLYAQNSGSLIIANNLASLISSYRDDDESLARAAVVAARLREAPQPALQDTWGWIAFRQGNTDEALTALEAAAEGLTKDPIVQYHLGRIYEDLGRSEQALTQYRKVADLTSEADIRTPVVDARARMLALGSQAEPQKD